MENQKKVKGFFKQYLPLIIIVACILAVAGTTLGVYFYVNRDTSVLPPDDGNPVVEPPDDGNEPVVEPPDDGNEPVIVVKTWGMPILSTFTIGMDYSEVEYVYCSTNREYLIHKAIDFKVTDNTEVVAVMDGTVESVNTTAMDGTKIVIRHDDGIRSIYSSLSTDTEVTTGQSVKKGDVIGYATDSADRDFKEGPHLNFQMSLNNVIVNPHNYLTKEV